MKKKTLSLALALAVCLGLLPTALAAPAAIATVKASEIVFNTGDDSQAVIVQSNLTRSSRRNMVMTGKSGNLRTANTAIWMSPASWPFP